MNFDITYSVPYEGDFTIHYLSVAEVLEWLDANSFIGRAEDARITPCNNPSYDEHEFRRTYGQ